MFMLAAAADTDVAIPVASPVAVALAGLVS